MYVENACMSHCVGIVSKGKMRDPGRPEFLVAVKTLKDDYSPKDKADLLAEAAAMVRTSPT